MGLNQGGSSNRTYLSIAGGKIAKRVPEGTAGSIKCMSKDGTKIWYEERYTSLSGYITDVFKRVSEQGYGDQLCIVLKDQDSEYQIQMPWSSRYSSGFFMCMPNIDAGKEVTLTPWSKEVDGKTRTMLYLRQGQEDIKWAWTKDNPGNMPEMKQVKVKGQVVWDDSERQEFFEKHLNDIFLPQVKSVSTIKKLDSHATEYVEHPGDDLPF
jgi:hypothetical protein